MIATQGINTNYGVKYKTFQQFFYFGFTSCQGSSKTAVRVRNTAAELVAQYSPSVLTVPKLNDVTFKLIF